MDFHKLKEQYGNFQVPVADIEVEGKSFGTNSSDLIAGEVTVELSTGYEASAAVFRIYNCQDADTLEYQMKDVLPFVSLGSSVRIKLGYASHLEEVFCGFIARTVFLKDEQGPCIEVHAMDVKGIMMENTYICQMKSGCCSGAVREILEKPVYQTFRNKGMIEKLDIQDTPDKGQNHLIEMAAQSDYEFIVKTAKRMGYEFFMEKSTLHFRKPNEKKTEQITLGPGAGIRAWEIGYDVRGLVQSIEVRGADDGKGERVSAEKKFTNKISEGNKAAALLSQTKKVCVDESAVSKEQAENRAQALLEQMSYRFGSMECECAGLPKLFPGYFIRISGFAKPADNLFYLTRVRHTMDEWGGYRTYISGCAAMLE